MLWLAECDVRLTRTTLRPPAAPATATLTTLKPNPTCSPRPLTNRIAAWSSPDLTTWRKEGLNILPLATADPASPLSSNYGAIFEPCGVYNSLTGFWSLFFLRDGYTLARAVARTAAGPFSVLQWDVPVPGFDQIVDFYFWQSLDGSLVMKHNGGGGESAVIWDERHFAITESSAIFGKELGYTEGGALTRTTLRPPAAPATATLTPNPTRAP